MHQLGEAAQEPGLETRYAHVARILAEAIATGRHPVGSVLPNELDLAKQFGVRFFPGAPPDRAATGAFRSPNRTLPKSRQSSNACPVRGTITRVPAPSSPATKSEGSGASKPKVP
ncbi:MAG: hypothetical protein B7Y95_18140 [Rhizobiales bacterium 32-66-11]|jgi:hypothetical protein|nr:MAG: hypothetical protein B7Y95_18140 [Rhizobiales bacterium 32-66-11]